MWNKILIGLCIALLIVAGYFYFQYQAEQKRSSNLELELSKALPLERIDSNTVRKTGVSLSDIDKFVKNVFSKIYNIAKERDQEIKYVTTVKTVFRVDTIKIRADSIIYVEGKEYGTASITNQWYNFSLRWACNPYEAQINSFSTWDRISLIGYTKEYDKETEYGVYAVNENPYNRIDSVNHFFRIEKPKRFTLGIGIGTNSTFTEIRPMIKAGFRPHSVAVQTDIKTLLKEKPRLDHFYFSYIYEF